MRLAGAMGASDPRGAWEQLKTITGKADRQGYVKALLATWAQSDPQGALKACGELPPGELRATAFATATGIWAEKAPAEAAAWVAAE